MNDVSFRRVAQTLQNVSGKESLIVNMYRTWIMLISDDGVFGELNDIFHASIHESLDNLLTQISA